VRGPAEVGIGLITRPTAPDHRDAARRQLHVIDSLRQSPPSTGHVQLECQPFSAEVWRRTPKETDSALDFACFADVIHEAAENCVRLNNS
jgi:hypothetical protein